MSVPEYEYLVIVTCPRHGHKTVYDGCDADEAEIMFRQIAKLLDEVTGCPNERVQMFKRPFKAELIAEHSERFSKSK